jgi:hypothetical protein
VGPWAKTKQLGKVWARRLEVLDKLNRAIDKCIGEETQDAALEIMAGMKDAKLPAWWDEDCDFFLLYGVHKHGFGNYDAIRGDPELLAVFQGAAAALGPAAEEDFHASVKAANEGGGGFGGDGGGGGGGAHDRGAAEEEKRAAGAGGVPARGYGASKHTPNCGCFVCKAKRKTVAADAYWDAAQAAAKDVGGSTPGGGNDAAGAGKAEGEDDEHSGGDEDMADAEADADADGDKHDGTDGDGAEEESEEEETEDEAEKRAEEETARAAQKEKTLERRRERQKLRRRRHNDGAESSHPNAWPSSETLTHRVKRLADKLGPVNALPSSDPPWVGLYLGHARKRPKRMDPFGGGEEDNGDAYTNERKSRKKARKDKNRRANADVAAAMARGEWDALGVDGVDVGGGGGGGGGGGEGVGLAARFAAEAEGGGGGEGDENGGGAGAGGGGGGGSAGVGDLAEMNNSRKNKSNFTKKDKTELLRAVMGFGLPRWGSAR